MRQRETSERRNGGKPGGQENEITEGERSIKGRKEREAGEDEMNWEGCGGTRKRENENTNNDGRGRNR